MTDKIVDRVHEALRLVIDPELGCNIVDLGLIYEVVVDEDAIHIAMTATTPGSPAASFLKEAVESNVILVAGVRSVDVVMTFEPRWTPDRIAPGLQAELGFAARN